jgi:parallel beta-helix repeat protein
VWLRSSNGTIVIDGVKITSWDDAKKDYDLDPADGRAFLVAKLGSRMDVAGAEIAYLGYESPPKGDASNYGISWQIPNGSAGQYLLTGHVHDSRFHHNYFGAYTFGATAMEWRGNQLYDNVRYGLDPHDDSNYFLIERNRTYGNGSHGIILSKRCIGNLIQHNTSYNNGLHGIMLHEDTNGNVVRANVAYGNRDGLALFDAHNNAIIGNSVYNNERGIRLNDGSSSNLIARNRINGQRQYGLYLYGAADGNALEENELMHNDAALYLKSSGNALKRNVVQASGIGVYLVGEARGNVLSGNVVGSSFRYDVYTKTEAGAANFLVES